MPTEGGAASTASPTSNVGTTAERAGPAVRPVSASATRFVLLYAATWLALAVITVAGYLTPLFSYSVISPSLDLVINTAAVVVAGSIVLRTWIRYADGGENDTLFQAAAFLALFVGSLLRMFLLVTNSPLYDGYRLDTPNQGPLYAWTLQRMTAGVVLVLGAAAVARLWPRPSRWAARSVLLLPSLLVVGLTLVLLAQPAALPALIPPVDLAQLLRPSDTFGGTISPPYFVTQLLIAAMFTASSIGYARLWVTRERRPETAFLAAALAIAAFSELHYAFVPGAYDGLLTSGDYLRLAFYVTVLAGSATGGLEDLRRLRRANTELAQLQRTEAERIALTERARLARDIHDGIAQELWLARLTTGQLSESADLPAGDRQAVDRLDSILDRALAEARQAIVTLQPTGDEGFGELLRRYVDDYADHFGMEIECSADADTAPSAHEQAELLRICREALNNARKHADASVVRVRLSSDNEGILMTIADNGKGFDSERTRAGFGLQSMRQRAESLGGELTVESAPLDGTRVTVRVPAAESA